MKLNQKEGENEKKWHIRRKGENEKNNEKWGKGWEKEWKESRLKGKTNWRRTMIVVFICLNCF